MKMGGERFEINTKHIAAHRHIHSRVTAPRNRLTIRSVGCGQSEFRPVILAKEVLSGWGTSVESSSYGFFSAFEAALGPPFAETGPLGRVNKLNGDRRVVSGLTSAIRSISPSAESAVRS